MAHSWSSAAAGQFADYYRFCFPTTMTPILTTAPATLECDGVLSDLILQAARQALPKDVDSLIQLPDVGIKNQPLLPLLIGLIDATKVVAKAIDDNAWDDIKPLPKDAAAGLIDDCREIMRQLKTATEAF
jgi:hypothetical protein